MRTENFGAKPELLCPAGSPLALQAAIEGGADAVYLGGIGFNARMNATNFDYPTLQESIRLAHLYGVKVYLTLNTLVFDRELPDYIRAAYAAACAGADALIVADAGGVQAIHRALPALPLHASTQMSAHNADAGILLSSLGYSRMVVARELSLPDLREAARRSPIEIEAFIHGALCVCHSGQCLFSSLVGGRSGNRGECAQPCRLPYRAMNGKEGYPLSLKDLTLSRHVPELLASGVRSLKIEGRMRAPAYVLTVSRIWRRLLDEERNATESEAAELDEAFSRSGFTDGYFTGKINHAMLGTRTEENKRAGKEKEPFEALSRRIPVNMEASFAIGKPATLHMSTGNTAVCVTGDEPQAALTAPLSEETVTRQLTKLGSTRFGVQTCRVSIEGSLMLPVSALNALRRAGTEALENALLPAPFAPADEPGYTAVLSPTHRQETAENSARFASYKQVTQTAAAYFDVIYLPPEEWLSDVCDDTELSDLQKQTQVGVLFPPVITDKEFAAVREQLAAVRARGICRAIVGNLGQIALAKELGYTAEGGFRLNVTNSETVALLATLGVAHPILSPELTLPQIRDIRGEVRTLVYGRIPLMLLEKCVSREIGSCDVCHTGNATLTDRRGVRFPVLRIPPHRNVLYNSVPTNMSDMQGDLLRCRVGGRHFLFSVETPSEVDAVIRAWSKGNALDCAVRRIGKA